MVPYEASYEASLGIPVVSTLAGETSANLLNEVGCGGVGSSRGFESHGFENMTVRNPLLFHSLALLGDSCPRLQGASGEVGVGEGVNNGGVPDQAATVLPWEKCDPVGAFALANSGWLHRGWDSKPDESPFHHVINGRMSG